MKFSSFSKRAVTHDNLRIVNARRAFSMGLVGACILALLTFAAGISLGRAMSGEGLLAAPLAKITNHDPIKEKFAIKKLGELSGRLLKLETDAAYLVKKVGDHEALARKLANINPDLVPADEQSAPSKQTKEPPQKTSSGEGGMLFPPRSCNENTLKSLPIKNLTLEDIDKAEVSISCLQQTFAQMSAAVAARNADFMAIPSLRPVENARVGSGFGNRRDPFTGQSAFHSGLDFASPLGTPIYAAAGGRVVSAGLHSSYGNLVTIDHGNGLVTRYAHTSKIFVKEGDVVMPHQLIAAMGSTGRSTGPHLHFEVLYKGEFVDPAIFLSLNNMEMSVDDLAAD